MYIIVIGVCGLFLIRYSSGRNLDKGKGTIRDKDCSQKKTKALGVLYQQLFKLPSFYLLMAVLIAIGFVGSFNTQNNIIIQNSGFGAAEAAYAVSSASIGLVIGKILLGFVSDRLTSVVSGFLAAFFLLVGLSGMLFSFATASVPVLVVSMLVAGMGSCAGMIMAPLYTMDAFGPRDYGAIYATMSIGNNIGLIIASPVISMIFDTSGSYFGAMVLFMGTAVLFFLGGFLAVKSGRRVWNSKRS